MNLGIIKTSFVALLSLHCYLRPQGLRPQKLEIGIEIRLVTPQSYTLKTHSICLEKLLKLKKKVFFLEILVYFQFDFYICNND